MKSLLRPTFLLLVAAALALTTACQPAPRLSAAQLKTCDVAAVGDSLTVGVEQHARLAGALTKEGCTLAWIDAKGGRKTGEGVDIVAARAAANQLPSVLIVGLGTNDRYELAHFAGRVDRIMQLANGRHVIWIDNAYVPVRGHVNAVLADKARQYPNLTIMSWNHEFWANSSWQATDKIHATPAGYQARANLMAAAAQRVTK